MSIDQVRPLDALRLHPDAERVPLADHADLATLRASLRENGQQDPIDVTSDDVILDGRTRLTLLRELGAQTVHVRVLDMPPEQQTHYIIDRALARRHLTPDQKRALNALLRETVVEIVSHPITGENVSIGRGQTQRAATLGVNRASVQRWDREDAGGAFTPSAPTHVRRSDGQIEPLHPKRKPASAQPVRSGKALPPTPKRSSPPWHRHFTLWCRRTLPEDRTYLVQMCVELQKALDRLEITCGGD